MANEFITTDDQHWYPSPSIEGVWYPSVTTILGACFPKGKNFERYLADQESYEKSQEILKAAGTRGTNVHKASELLEKGDVLLRANYSLEEWQMLMSFVTWHRKNKPVSEAVEISICSDEYRTGGTIDRIYVIMNGKRTLLDLKTSSAIHPNYWCQTAVYVKLWEEKNPDRPVDQTAILRLGSRHKDKFEFQVHDRAEIENDFLVFQAVQKIWNYLYPNAKPRIVDVPETLSLN